MVARIAAAVAVVEFSDLDGPELWEAVRASCLANLDAGLSGLTRGLELPDEIPAEARGLALLAASPPRRRGVLSRLARPRAALTRPGCRR